MSCRLNNHGRKEMQFIRCHAGTACKVNETTAEIHWFKLKMQSGLSKISPGKENGQEAKS